MVQRLLILAFVANLILLVSTTGKNAHTVLRNRNSHSSSHSSTSQTSAFNAFIPPVGPCSHGDGYQHTSTSSAKSSSNSFGSSTFSPSSATSDTHGASASYHPDCRTCNTNERWVRCPEAVCVPKTCNDVGRPIQCYELNSNGKCPGNPGCICKEGLVRNSKGNCVPVNHCHSKPAPSPKPVKCKNQNEVYDLCPANCPFRTCGINDAAVSCVPALPIGHPDCPPPKCRCKDGFYKNNFGQCVRWEECPTCNDPNEIYDACPARCPPRTCDVNEALILCEVPPQLGDPRCEPGCRCIDGYVKNSTNVCIPKEQCPKCTQPNEVYDPCIVPCNPRRCDVDERLIKCAQPQVGSPLCEAGCRCADGFKRNSEGICIPADECFKCSKPHEVYDACPDPNPCSSQTCENVNKKFHCPKKDTAVAQVCNGQCVCEAGYFRNIIGECIAKEDCLKCTGPHEYFSCGSACDNECKLLHQQNQTNCPIVNIVCNQKCYCEEGYARDENNICIPIEQCSASCGGDPNQVAGCGVYCNQRCRDVGKEPGPCILICYPDSCDCRPGFYLDENTGKCVLPQQCTQQCPINEVYNECIQGDCGPKSCTDLGFPLSCPRIDPKYCKKGCTCKEGYVRNENGTCIPSTECPSCGGDPNAQSGCGTNCNKLCSDVGKQSPSFCILSCQLNGCDCKDGYYYDNKTKRCVKPEECVTAPLCLVNEWYSDCIQGSCSPQSCKQLGYPIPCPDVDQKDCKKGCLCNEGFVRNDKGICIPSSKCPSCGGDPNQISGCGVYCNQRCRDVGKELGACIRICYPNSCDCRQGLVLDENTGKCVPPPFCTPQCPVNEVYSTCIQGNCEPKNCNEVGLSLPCPSIDSRYCQKGCICKEGYVRNNEGMCIPSIECPPQCPINEVYSICIQGNCEPKNCNEVGLSLPCPIIDSSYCQKGCICKEGYVRNNDGICIPSIECPPQCPVNEVYNECIQGDCGPKSCTDLGFPLSCPRIDPKYCKKGCTCKNGYVRNENGICIPSTECPSCGGDPNAQPGCGTNCNKLCSDVGKQSPSFCILSCQLNGCDCKDGYYYDNKTKRCVKPQECVTAPLCPVNEWYSDCIQGSCSPQSCQQLGYPIPCPDIDQKDCKKGCLCNEGFVRNDKGICIPSSECPSCGGDSNQVAGCGVYCNQRCRDVGKEPGLCILICYPNSCDCRQGLVLDENTGKCVPPPFCTPQCPINEVYSTCIQGNCGPKNCNELGLPLPCPRIDPRYCQKGCICKEGYVRNNDGICIPSIECPSCGNDPNAQAGCGTNCNKRCSDIGKEPGVCILSCNYNGCDCKDGYYLDDSTNKCVKPEECNRQCPANEYYSDCIQGDCSPQNCTQIGFPIGCPRIDPKFCKKGCLCNEGFVRNENGICIPSSQCPSCGGDVNQVAGCGVYCNQRCRDVGKEPGGCIDVCYSNACNCREGLFLDENTGKCVPPQYCTTQCPANEVYNECIQGDCRAKNCSQLGLPLSCPRIDPKHCIKGCVCKEGYIRNDAGICILSTDCPTCGGDPNAQSGCGTNCNKHCSDIGKETGVCILSCDLNGCDCKDGYYLDGNTNKCVKPEECTPQCPANEWYSECIEANCSPQNCTQLGYPIACPFIPDPKYCQKGCICKSGFVRNEYGLCIPSTECPSCRGDPNAQAGCGVNCNKRCSDIGKEPGFCPAICELNGCDCKDGYYFNENTGTCVKPENCGPVCLESNNEVYSDCINGGCQAKNCTQYNKPVPCVKIDPSYCIKGCLCKEGYLRAANGKCVPERNCPEACNGYMEEYNECSWDCPPQTCESLDKVYACPIMTGDDCKPMCKCKSGYFRNKIGQCISEEECRRCMGPNEYYSCGGACDNVCKTLNEQSQDNCPIVNIKCNEMCYCEKGYARANNNTCIPISSCANDRQCPANEYYSDCIQGDCSPQYCTQIGFPISCPRIDPKFCKKGCLCNEGFVRNENGICIPSSQCPSCGGDVNQVAGCGVYCNQRCRDVGKEPGGCIDVCYSNACNCRQGLFLDENTGKCVPPQYCTTQCPANEVYNECIQGDCRAKNCSQLGLPLSCPRIDPKYCIKGCVCKEGYIRNDAGICILSTDCPTCGGDPNAQSGCGTNCNKHCSDIGKETGVCILSCDLNGCDCKDGYYLDGTTNKCVKPEECTPQCPANELYSECIEANCSPQNCTQLGYPIPCPFIPDPKYCQKGCICKSGFVRNAYGLCIPSTECPSCRGDPNAQAGCGVNCNKRCSDIGKEPGFCPALCILNGCDCKDGYYFNENTGTCVKPENCGPVCLESNNEVYSDCINGGCQAKNCTQYNKPVPCVKLDPRYCIKGCLCKEGYLRAANGKCVPERNCPEPQCPVNEKYESCPGQSCQPQYCSQLGQSIPCPGNTSCPKKPACVCIDGYVRNDFGICIPIRECPSCGGDPNSESGCGVNCGRRCSDIGKGPVACPLICKLNGCDCKKGFYYDDITKKCVREEDCTKAPVCLEKNNEVYSDCINGGCGLKNCSQYGSPEICVRIDPKYCIKGCLCKEGYLRASNGKCVPQQSCPEACNGPNEEYTDCSFNCPPQTCESLDMAYVCPIREGEDCQPMCRCKPGFYRNRKGACITEEQCRMCTGPNEFYACGGACDNVCKNLHIQNQTNCPIINIRCNDKCYCDEGYARARNNTCIPISNCNERQCRINERYEACPEALCEPQKCSQLGYPIPCPILKRSRDGLCRGKPGCVCNEGYVRNEKGKCIPMKQCPSCNGDPNAESGCGVNCGKTCKDLGRDGGVACIDLCKLNSCDCKDGYYYDSIQKKCVLPGECTDICGKNEIFEDCSNPSCRPKNCTQLGFPLNCDSKCFKGCICQEGYARDNKGICIPIRKCPSCGGDPNAQSGCGINCLKKCYDLANPERPKICPKICKINSCDCREGYYLDENTNKCVPRDSCSQVCGANEVYSSCVNGGCEMKNCSQLGSPQICIDPIKCVEGCICKEGYLRNNGICVPIDQCPTPTCRKNEIFSQCPAKQCKPQSCRDVGFPIKCLDENEKCPGQPACICANGYVRNNKGICRPISECPSCGGDPNAKSGCGINCGKRCPNNNLNPKLCPRICLPNSCDCKDGFYYDANVKQCVKFEDCSPRCDELNNEVYDSCVNGGCGWKNCTQVGGPILCIDPIKCDKGCSCKSGYYRLPNGTCVPENQCPAQVCGANEVYSSCVNGGCELKNCSQLGGPQICIDPIKCIEGCICKEGYLRNNGICVPIDQCPTPTCRKNEIFSQCPAKECKPQSCRDVGFPIKCVDENESCPGQPACICANGYVRNDKGICRPISECPSCGGDPNAISGCGINCGKRCPNNNLNPKLCPRICLPNRCDCRDGFYYDANVKQCVKFEDCSPRCDDLNNEVYDSCVNGGCGWKNCTQVGGPILCIDPIKCDKGCSCKSGYYRLPNGTCVPENKCPTNCWKPNEMFYPCPKCTEPTCDTLIHNQYPICSKNKPETCKGECRCKPYFYRNKIGECIKKEECLKCTGPHEYFSCGPACDNVCSKLAVESKDNCSIVNVQCNRKCYCEDGYARNEKGTCIPIHKCTGCRKPANNKPKPPVTTVPATNATAAIAKFERGNQALAGECLYHLLSSRPGENFMVSGFSLLIIMAQLALKSVGVSAQQLFKLLNVDTADEIRAAFPILINNYRSQQEVIFKVADRIFVSNKSPITNDYQRELKEYFDSEVQNLDFTKNQEAAAIINQWAEENTNGLIKNLVNPSMFDGSTRCVLTNALYFLGNWQNQFNKNDTMPRDFYLSNGETVTRNMMYQEGRFRYAESDELDCKILQLYYKGGNFSFMIYLPNKINGLSSMVAKLRDPENVDKSSALLKMQRVRASVPTMDVTTDWSDLADFLKKLNLTEPFNPNAHSFEGIIQSGEELSISDVVQKTRMKVDETGTEAAAATAVLVGVTSVQMPSKIYDFNCNHPSAFYLMLGDFPVFYGIHAGAL